MPLYRIEMRVVATAYINADSPGAAKLKARGLAGAGLEVSDTGGSEVDIFGGAFSDPDMPELSLSPAMTINGVEDDSVVAEKVED